MVYTVRRICYGLKISSIGYGVYLRRIGYGLKINRIGYGVYRTENMLWAKNK